MKLILVSRHIPCLEEKQQLVRLVSEAGVKRKNRKKQTYAKSTAMQVKII